MAEPAGNETSDAYEEASRAWPGLSVSRQRFEAFLGDEAGRSTNCAGDVLLALGCIDHDPRALELFEIHVMRAIRASVERACRDGSVSVDDVMQTCREALLIGREGGEPKLVGYRGRGALTAWVRVVAVREALQERRRSRRVSVVDPIELLADVASTFDDETDYLRQRYGESLRDAVRAGLARLAPEQRLLLKLHTQDGLSIDQLAPMLGVHRATAARRLERARLDGLVYTRAALRERHGLSDSEARSICVALGNEIDMSLGRALGTAS